MPTAHAWFVSPCMRSASRRCASPDANAAMRPQGAASGDIAREQADVRDPELTLDIPRGRARQLDESEQPKKIDGEPKQETPHDAGRMPANTRDEPEIGGPEMDHEIGLHL